MVTPMSLPAAQMKRGFSPHLASHDRSIVPEGDAHGIVAQALLQVLSACVIVGLVAGSYTTSERDPATMSNASGPRAGFDEAIGQHAQAMFDEGRQTFRFDTFGSEAFWGGALQLHRAIAGAKVGGVGPEVS